MLHKLKSHLHLEWIYQEENVSTSELEEITEIVIPPQKELDTLYDLAAQGSIKALMRQAQYLEKLNKKFTPFAQQLLELANDFQDAKIVELISQYRSR